MIVLDTHAWIWWASDPGLLSPDARDAVDGATAARDVCVSSVSVWEVALLVKRGRLELTLEPAQWVRRAEALPFLRFVPVDNAIALRSVQLDGRFHQDPADRIIVATALSLEASLVTKDRRMHDHPAVRAVW